MVILLSIVILSAPPAPRCVPGSLAQLEALVQQTGRDRVVFFATWCAPCRDHVLGADARTILVGAFDEAERISRAARQVDPRIPCLVDHGIAAALGVHAIPAARVRRAEGWVTP